MKHIIKSIDPTSPLRRKVRVGEQLLAVNGKKIIEVLDYKFYSYEAQLLLELETPEGQTKLVSVKKPLGADLGLSFETYLMDRPRRCANNCVFCFVDQTPPGMRQSLYFKDDDARLSFLMGCYITLTNLSPREVQRIIDLHISPVNISVHATDPVLREKLLKNPRAGQCLDIMGRFAEAGITMNCQIVCCPGWNDGAALERSMSDLLALHPAVHSVSVVPVGLTRHREGLPHIEAFTPETAAQTIAQVTAFGDKCLAEKGERIFFCSDELYLKAGLPLPEDDFYEDHAQLENGVGMLRLLEAEFKLAMKLGGKPERKPAAKLAKTRSDTLGSASDFGSATTGDAAIPGGVSTPAPAFSLACGTAVAPFMEKLLCTAKEKYDTLNYTVYPIKNDFFGHSVDVSGLITGRDLIAQLKGKALGDYLLISQNMLRREEMDFLDDVTLEQASAALGLPIYPIEQDGGALWDAVCGELPSLRLPKRDGEDTEYYRYNQN